MSYNVLAQLECFAFTMLEFARLRRRMKHLELESSLSKIACSMCERRWSQEPEEDLWHLQGKDYEKPCKQASVGECML
jgi:hypothetical protein